MKKFKFSLESVLTLRHFRKMEAAGELAQKSRLRTELEEKISNAKQRLAAIELEFQRSLKTNLKASQAMFIRNAISQQVTQIGELEDSFLKAIEKENEARQAVVLAQQKYEALIKLEEKQRQVALKEAIKEEDLAMAEFVSSRATALGEG